MTLKEWRNKKKLTQVTLARMLEEFTIKSGSRKKLKQSTLGYWENGTLPRKGWLTIINEFTKGQVSPDDFIGA